MTYVAQDDLLCVILAIIYTTNTAVTVNAITCSFSVWRSTRVVQQLLNLSNLRFVFKSSSGILCAVQCRDRICAPTRAGIALESFLSQVTDA